jgi:hypothetical protein
MKRTQGLVPLAVLHHVTAAIALLVMLGHCLSPGEKSPLLTVLQLCAFAFFTVIVRRGWASIDGGSIGMSPGKAQGFLWIPFFNFFWVFPALVSLATQTNEKADAEQNPAGRITRGFGLVIAILFSVTALTALASSQLPLFAWLNLVVYATYIGFAVTYIWQIKLAAEAFDAKAVPALREPAKMPTVGIAGIIYGCACAALLLFSLTENLSMSPEVIEQRLKAKGYTVTYADATTYDFDRLIMKGLIHTDHMQILQVKKDGRSIGHVYFATALSSDAAEKVAQGYGTATLKAGNVVLFRATIDGRPSRTNLPIDEWLDSF